jgi:hypothetical protein
LLSIAIIRLKNAQCISCIHKFSDCDVVQSLDASRRNEGAAVISRIF